MSDQDQRANTEKNHEFSAPQTRKKIRPHVKKLSLIVASGLLTLTAYASNTYTIREVQLMLSLSGYNLSYGDSKGIDGKLGQITREAIKDYQAKKHLTPTGNVDKWLYDSLYEDTKSKPPTPPAAEKEKNKKDQPASETDDDNKTINALSGELKTIKDGMSDRFISYFYTQSALLASFLALLVIVLTFTATFWINKLIGKIGHPS